MKLEHGVLVEAGTRNGLTAFISNCQIDFTDDHGDAQKLDDACLILCRESFGYGRMHVIPRGHIWMYHDKYYRDHLDTMLAHAAGEIYGAAVTSHDCQIIGDVVYNALDQLFRHPPEDQATLLKKQEKEIERLGLVVNYNGRELINAS